MNFIKKDFIFEDVGKLKGVGEQLSLYLKKKKIEKIKDIILNFPYSETDRSKIYKLNELMDDSEYCKKTQYCNNVICRSDLENLNEDELNNIAKQWGIDIYQDQSTIINTLMQYYK